MNKNNILHRQYFRYSGHGLLAEQLYVLNDGILVNYTRLVRGGMLVIQDRDGNNAVLREYTWGLNLGGGIGGLLNLNSAGQNYAYLYDGKGNVEAVLNASQQVVAAYRYDPFGVLLNKTGSFEQPYGFSTKRYNAPIGMVQYEFRNYFPELVARWDSRDPLGEAGGLNLYAFVGNNPVNWVDPWGLFQSPQWMLAVIPGQGYWDAAITDMEQGKYLGAVGNTLNMLTYQALFLAMLGQSPVVQQGITVCSLEIGPGIADAAALDSRAQKILRSLQKQIDSHQQKLVEFMQNPDKFDNQGFLKNAPTEEIRQKIIAGRIQHLQHEIEVFKKHIEAILHGRQR